MTLPGRPVDSRLFKGLSAFPLTPAGPDGSVDVAALGRLLERLVSAGVSSIGLLGSTGLSPYLTRDERRRAVAAAASSVGGRVPIMVGIGALRTDAAEDLARDAEAAGADAVLLSPVSYIPLTDEEVVDHFKAVADATRLPLCIYNNPATTHFTFGYDLIRRLAEVETIRAIKMPLPAGSDFGGELSVLRRNLRFAIGYSGDWGACDALLAGADCWYSVVAGLFPRSALSLTRAAQAGDTVAARAWDTRFAPLWDIFRAIGSLRAAYVLYRLLGFGELRPPRPLHLPGEADQRRIEAAFMALEHFEHALKPSCIDEDG